MESRMNDDRLEEAESESREVVTPAAAEKPEASSDDDEPEPDLGSDPLGDIAPGSDPSGNVVRTSSPYAVSDDTDGFVAAEHDRATPTAGEDVLDREERLRGAITDTSGRTIQ